MRGKLTLDTVAQEETGMILQTGRWALMQAVADSRAWQAKGLRAA
ncbi:MAG TPA: hypothetical protein PK372_05660 [Rugosibacter sp.]|nr:hypothetical protein [Rugosibacter sp.]